MYAVYLSAKKVFDNKMGSGNSRRGSTVVPIATKTHKNLPKMVGQLRWLQELLQRIQGPYEEFNNTNSPFANYQYMNYHDLKQDGRLPPAYFAPSPFGKHAILKDENVFSSKKHSFFIVFSNFSNVQNFLICQKNLIIRAEKTFLNIIIR